MMSAPAAADKSAAALSAGNRKNSADSSTPSPPMLAAAKQLAKLRRFLSTLIQFGLDISPDVGDRVRDLVIRLLNSNVTISEFHSELHNVTNYPLRAFVIPFLRASLPLMQCELLHRSHLAAQSPSQFLAGGRLATFLQQPQLPPSSGDTGGCDIGRKRHHSSVEDSDEPKDKTRRRLSSVAKDNVTRPPSEAAGSPTAAATSPESQRHQLCENVGDALATNGQNAQSPPQFNQPSQSPRLHQPSQSLELHQPSQSPRLHQPSQSPELHQPSQSPQLQQTSQTPKLHQESQSPQLHQTSQSPQLHQESRSQQRSRIPRLHQAVRAPTGSEQVQDADQDADWCNSDERDTTNGSGDEWSRLESMLTKVCDLVGKVRRSLQTEAVQRRLQPCQHRCKRAGEQRLQNLDAIVSSIRIQAQEEVRAAVAAAEIRAVELAAAERLRGERLVAQAREDALAAFRVQTSSAESCWNCGRAASETCSGCSTARYCGSFCQHKDWDRHQKACELRHIQGSLIDTSQLVSNNGKADRQ